MPSILHCIPTLGGGGAERQLTYLGEGLVKRGWSVHVAYLRDGPNSARLKRSGVQLHRLPGLSHYDPILVWKLSRLIRQARVQLVQTWLTQMDVFGGIAAALSRVPFVVSERSSALCYSASWKNRLRLAIGKHARALVANSKEGLTYWRNSGYDGLGEVVRNAVPFQEIEAAPRDDMEQLGFGRDTELIVYAGRYSAEKNLFNLLAALAIVLDSRPNAVALLFGDGPLRAELSERIRRSGFETRLKALGFTSSLWGILKRADVFASVSRFEGNPNTVLEAISARCPVVLSDIPAHREFIDDQCAFLAPTDLPESIARSILHALSDRPQALRRAARAFESISRWSVDAATDRYLALYAKVLSSDCRAEGEAHA